MRLETTDFEETSSDFILEELLKLMLKTDCNLAGWYDPFKRSSQKSKREVMMAPVGCQQWNGVEKEASTHSSVLAWRIPGTEEPGGLPSMGSHRVGHD